MSPSSVTSAENKRGDEHILTSGLSGEHAVLSSVLLMHSLQAVSAGMTSSLFVGSHSHLL